MPFLVEADEPPLDELVAGAEAADELDGCVVAGPDELDGELLTELEEFEPQAATAIATSTSARGASRRTMVCVFEFMNAPLTSWGKLPLIL
jgi:hypothetical protein